MKYLAPPPPQLPPQHQDRPSMLAAIPGRRVIYKRFWKINFLHGYDYATIVLFSGAPGKTYY